VLEPFEEALADARGRCHPEQPWRVSRHGVDTVSFAWRDFDADAAVRRLAVTRPDPATGEFVSARRKGASSWLTDALSGARVGLTRSPTGALLLWCEGRLAALCAGDITDHSLASPNLLEDGARRASALATRLGRGARDNAPVLVRRLDLAADLAFAKAVDGQAFLQAMAHLDCPGYKRSPIHSAGGSSIESVEWRTPKTFRVVHRCYDKGVESATAAHGVLVRLERQWWVPSSERMAPAVLADADFARLFAGPLRGWVQPGVGVMAVGPYDACALLRERVGQAQTGGPLSPLLTLRVAERMAGTIGVLSVYGDDWFGNARTAQRRRAQLRKVGIEFVSELAPGVRVDVGAVLCAACAAWKAPAPRLTQV
jgi:hypothetical protein